jgi:H+/Cl- antiporter ClcA
MHSTALEEDTAMTEQAKTGVGRRDFLRALGAGAGVAVTAAAPLATSAAAAETQDEQRKSRYRETDHVKTFYRVNRY